MCPALMMDGLSPRVMMMGPMAQVLVPGNSVSCSLVRVVVSMFLSVALVLLVVMSQMVRVLFDQPRAIRVVSRFG